MKTLASLLIIVNCSISVCYGLHAVSTTTGDSIVRNDSVVHCSPYHRATLLRSMGYFNVVVNNPISFQTYAGFNVLNTLRGQLPLLSLGPNTNPPFGGFGASLMVIDGLPFNSTYQNYYNLNSFDYRSVYAVGSGNGATLYGGAGASGALFLHSKTGENITKPLVEFNSSSTLWRVETTSLTGETESAYQSLFTNAIAYSQDFGPVDTRVSYTYNAMPDGSSPSNVRSNYHNLRINTGFNLGQRLRARLILDDFYDKGKSTSSYLTFHGLPITFESDFTKKNLLGNLLLQYNIQDWLGLSAQGSLSKIENNDSSNSQYFSKTDRNQKRKFVNFFAYVHKPLSRNFTLTSSVGLQYEKRENWEGRTSSSGNYGWASSENITKSLLGNAGIQFKNYWFLDGNYRLDYLSVYAEDNNQVPSYSLNTAFIFSDAFHWENSWFSLGKVRMSTGKSSVAAWQGYPGEWMSSMNAYPTPDLHASSKRIFETGLDMEFLDRIVVNATYFSNEEKDLVTTSSIPSGANSSMTIIANNGTLTSKGWQVVLGTWPVRKTNFTLETKLIWATSATKVTLDLPGGTGTGGGSLRLGNPNPDWTGSLLNQVIYKGFFSSLLIDVRRGGDIYASNQRLGYPPSFIIEDGTMAKLRDLSFGYIFSGIKKLYIREIQLSLSGRNLWTIYSKTETNAEDSNLIVPQQSGSLSLTMTL